MRRLRFAVGLTLLTGCASPQLATPGLELSYGSLSRSDAELFAQALQDGREKVERYWGKTFTGTMRVEVSSHYRISRALVRAWTGDHGRMEFPAAPSRSPTIHEIVHVYAPNQNRFLAEGLAVYLHHVLGGNPAFPNFGQDLAGLSRGVASPGRLAKLDAVSTPMSLESSGEMDERSAYILAGSFVGFLIETYGLHKFKELYGLTPLRPQLRGFGGATTRYSSVYGKSLDQLEREWQERISR